MGVGVLVAGWVGWGVIFFMMLAAAMVAGVVKVMGVTVVFGPPFAWGVGEMAFGARSSSSEELTSEGDGGSSVKRFG